MKTIRDIKYFKGVKVLVRADFNVPLKNGKVADDYRIRMTLPTINTLQKSGAKVILISHLETNDGKNVSLRPIADSLVNLGVPVTFVDDYKNVTGIVDEHTLDGGVVLLENLRFFSGEKNNDMNFAKELASLGDIYINDAFPVSHREHASIVSLPRFMPSYAGLQFEKEVSNLGKTFNPPRPFVFILNGAKFETKMPLLQKFLDIADTVFVGGALANDFFKLKGFELGQSLVSKNKINLEAYINSPKLLLPIDVMDENRKIWLPDGFPKDRKIVDAGPDTIKLLKEKISSANFVLWNGPTGLYEQGYNEMTEDLANSIVDATKKGLMSVVGGGDTVAAIQKMDMLDEFTFVSSGGGAMLDFLAKGTLPGIEALNESRL